MLYRFCCSQLLNLRDVCYRITGSKPKKTIPQLLLFGARFAGAIPEVANCRLAMLGVVLALSAEATTGKNVFQQISAAPIPIALTFFTFILATAVPVFRGLPRRGNAIFSSDAEIINGRFAMIGFLGLVISTFYKGSALWFL